MERQLPKNVRQIGNVCDEPKIYMEDYVDTYLSQIRAKALDEFQAAALIGEIVNVDGQAVVYIQGALQMDGIEINGQEIKISDDVMEGIEEKRKEYFKEQNVVGWCLVENGRPMGLRKGTGKVHGRIFAQENSVFIWKDALENDEVFFAYKYGDLMQMGGHYIYYEKNPDMQNYMISTRKQNGVTPSEVVEDRVAKDFRSTIREKNAYREQRQSQSSRFVYITSILLVIVVLAIGVSAMNNYDKMESVQDTLETLSREVSRPKEEVEQKSDAGSELADVVKDVGEENAQEAVEGDPSSDETGETGDATGTTEYIPEEKATLEQLKEGDFYVVQKGDTLDSISIDLYGNRDGVEAICKMNGLSDGNLIFIGQKLLLP